MAEVAALVSLLALLLPLPGQPQASLEPSPAALPTAGPAGETPLWPALAGSRAESEELLLVPELPAAQQKPVSQFTQAPAPEAESPDLMVSPLLLPRGTPDSSSPPAFPIPDVPMEKKKKGDLLNGLQPDAGGRIFTMSSLVEMTASEPPQAESLGSDIVDDGPFFRGRAFLEANVGAYFSQRGLGPSTPAFDFMPVNLRLGMVLNDPCFPGILRGSFEAMAELSTAPVVHGFGNIVVGPTALLRFNWVQPNSRLVPYLQGGAGFAYNDAYEDRVQHAIGQAVEFTLKAAAGCHYFVNDHVSLEVEAGYTHISNADLAPRNLGINSVGGSIGITFYFPCGRH